MLLAFAAATAEEAGDTETECRCTVLGDEKICDPYGCEHAVDAESACRCTVLGDEKICDPYGCKHTFYSTPVLYISNSGVLFNGKAYLLCPQMLAAMNNKVTWDLGCFGGIQ